jgi:hypothetical protein
MCKFTETDENWYIVMRQFDDIARKIGISKDGSQYASSTGADPRPVSSRYYPQMVTFSYSSMPPPISKHQHTLKIDSQELPPCYARPVMLHTRGWDPTENNTAVIATRQAKARYISSNTLTAA